jgi:hypothetical protein
LPGRSRDGELFEVGVVAAVAGVPGLHAPEAAVLELHEDGSAVLVDGVGESFETRDERRVVDAGHARGGTATLAADQGGALMDRADAGGRGRFEFVDKRSDCPLTVAGTLQQWGPVQAVAKLDATNGDGVVERRHGCPLQVQ